MHKILIVDDELAARETIRLLVDWEKIGFLEPAMAANGQQALMLYEQELFDLVLTDIEMPVMDGLEMIRRMKEQNPDQKFVIISCHESFDYAKRALKMGVSEYLIKDLMTSEELYSCLLENIAEGGAPTGDAWKEGGQDFSNLLLKLISKEPLVKAEEQQVERLLGRFQKGTRFCVGIASMDDRGRSRQGLDYQVISRVKAFYQKMMAEGGVAALLDDKNVVFLFRQPMCRSTAEKMNRTVEYLKHIRGLAKACQIPSLTIGVSEETEEIQRLDELYEQAKKACDMKVFRGMNRTIFYHAIKNNCWGLQGKALEECLDRLKDMIISRDARYRELLKKLYRPNLSGGFPENNYLSYVNWKLWNILFDVRKKLQGKEGPGAEIMDQGVERINQLESGREMEAFFEAIISGYFMEAQEGKEAGIVQGAKRYVEERIGEEISLAKVADALHVHKGYLCRVFKEETGTNFVNYIRAEKMKKAKEYLEETTWKTYEIADRLGFQSPQYFSLVFKKEVGMSPNDYRNRQARTRS